jgi:hypothetical protein
VQLRRAKVALLLFARRIFWRLRMADEPLVKLTGPVNITSMSIGGVTLPVVDGMIEVPMKFEEQLAAHGFVRYVPPPAPEKLPPPPPMARSARKGTGQSDDQGY